MNLAFPQAIERLTDRQKMMVGLALVVGGYLVYKWQQDSLSNPLMLGDGKLRTTFGAPGTSYTNLATQPAKPKPVNTSVPLDLPAGQAANVLGSESLHQQLPSFFGGDPEGLHPTDAQNQAASKITDLAKQQYAQSVSGIWGRY